MTAVTRDHIAVCVCTYRRNKMLARLLRRLARQDTGSSVDMTVVVVDNDVDARAREVVLRLHDELGLDVTYGVEPVRTIPAARNHALRIARGNYIGIIDDDEFPREDWLVTMWQAIQTFDVDGVFGPVFPFFEKQPPAWLLRGQFSGAPSYRTGTLLHWRQTYTGNVLFKRDVLDRHDLWFDENFKTGGSDQEFFRQAMNAGCRFVAVAEAAVYEVVPPERWTKGYYVKRALVNGFNAHRTNAKRNGERFVSAVKSAAALFVYVCALPVCTVFGTHAWVSCVEKGGWHLSRLFAMVGIELVKQRDF